MLSPVSLRICWIAAMAPALTEAATQADNFNLPATSNINFASPTLDKFGDISLQTLTEIGLVGGKHKPQLSPGSEDFIKDPQVQKCRLPWKALGLHAENYSNNNIKHNGGLAPLVNGHNWTVDEDALKSKRLVEVAVDRRKNCKPTGRTMNKDLYFQDNMGLLKANTSLECENKNRNLGPHVPQVMQKLTGCPEPTKKWTVNDKNCNSALRRFTVNENFKNFQWSKMSSEPTDEESSSGNIFSRNSALKARARQVLRRVRKLQLRQVECHTKNQLKSFVEHEQRTLGISCQRQLESNILRARHTEELKAELLQSADVKLLSASALVSLVRKLEHGTSFTHSRNLCESLLNKDKKKVVARVNPAECQEIKRTSGMLLGNIRHLESAADSDATESSSGGESTDELTDSEDLNKAGVLSSREATVRWSVDRASAASQWTWLQAQVSDLEYKIRQQNELYRQVRTSKGAVSLEGGRKDNIRTDERTSPEQRIGAREESKTVNGFLDGVSNGFSAMQVRRLIGETSEPQKLLEVDACSRTRPLKKVFRKRKLLRTAGLHVAGRKMSRLSSVKCGCNSTRELLPCILCGGRYNNTQTLDPDVMPMPERIALLDASYHLVLSFKQDTPLSLHFEKLLRREEYCKPVKSAISVKKKARIPIKPLKSLNDQARKHSRKLAKNAAQTLLTSAKLRKKMGTTRRTNRRRFLLSKREDPCYRKKFSTLAAYRRRRTRRRSGSMSSESSKPGSPVPSPLSSGTDMGGYGQPGKVSSLQDISRRKRLDSAYDIDNIVIPYSIAATTRVEKLQYKEILTPKWRLIEPDEPPPENEPLADEDDEDVEAVSDDHVAARHLKCELEEKKRFTGYKQMMHGRSRLRSIRGDGRADSSGANTPDPMSPHQSDTYSHDSWMGGWNSPVASPPPVVVQMEEQGTALPFIRPERRRTISKRLSEDDRSSLHEETPAQPPYEHRTFPLSDEEYEEMRRVSLHLEHRNRSASPCGSTSSGCSVPEDDDPADPEWTVVTEDGSSQKQSLVLKLAKR